MRALQSGDAAAARFTCQWHRKLCKLRQCGDAPRGEFTPLSLLDAGNERHAVVRDPASLTLPTPGADLALRDGFRIGLCLLDRCGERLRHLDGEVAAHEAEV